MEATDAVELYRLLTAAGERCWLVGGWGVDALLGRQTRPHHDLDVLTLLADLPVHTDRLARRGFGRVLVWEENRWLGAVATAFVLADAAGRQLDVHVLAAAGTPAWAADPFPPGYLDARGIIAGTEVATATAAAQLDWHTGYDLPDTHHRDVAHLHALLGAPDRPADATGPG